MAPAQEVHRRVRTGDERKPQCRHCEISRRVCEYEALDNSALREDGNGLFQFSADHVWLETPSEITFVHSVDVADADNEEQPLSTATRGHATNQSSINKILDEPVNGNEDCLIPYNTSR
ncbi:hypothetical protein CFAM422_001814 [Trichoderma lentiforme]|uniref:Uncharacterized protein n=1 Tax=Trichoderma lentiforme TaxID=1567552 RepID=A0A9P4XPQ2_9HYPO|nr:hypothetical protein CFAM422_001814 [Trichoderma lentiforme]